MVVAAVALALQAAIPAIADARKPIRDVTAEIISVPIDIRLPIGSCVVPSALGSMAFALRFPVGIEFLPGECTPSPRQDADAVEVITLQTMTVAEAMNLLVKLDPRYYWTESDGVVVVRPLDAWSDGDHFLHRTFAGLHLDKANIGEALDRALVPLREYRDFSRQLMTGVGEITVDTGAISVADALDAIVRAEGGSFWEVKYCRPERSLATATVGIYTFDRRGLGARFQPFARDKDGTLIDPCRVP